MKTQTQILTLILSLVLFPTLLLSQNFFDKYEDYGDVGSIIVNQKMFNMLSDIEINDPDAGAFMIQAGKLKNLSVYTTSSREMSSVMEGDVAEYIEIFKLEELMRIKVDGSNIKFYVLEGKDDNHVNELLMFSTELSNLTVQENYTINGTKLEFETVLLSLKGDIDLREVSKLTSKLNVPGGDLLKNADKKLIKKNK
jgi:hypothetical protein